MKCNLQFLALPYDVKQQAFSPFLQLRIFFLTSPFKISPLLACDLLSSDSFSGVFLMSNLLWMDPCSAV